MAAVNVCVFFSHLYRLLQSVVHYQLLNQLLKKRSTAVRGGLGVKLALYQLLYQLLKCVVQLCWLDR